MPAEDGRTRLFIPKSLLPSADDEVRWKALRKCCEQHSGSFSEVKQEFVLSHSDLERYASGDQTNMSADMLFIHFYMLLLVGGDDLLLSVVDTGKYTGKNVLEQLADKWEEVMRCNIEQARSSRRTINMDQMQRLLETFEKGRVGRTTRPKGSKMSSYAMHIVITGLILWYMQGPSKGVAAPTLEATVEGDVAKLQQNWRTGTTADEGWDDADFTF